MAATNDWTIRARKASKAKEQTKAERFRALQRMDYPQAFRAVTGDDFHDCSIRMWLREADRLTPTEALSSALLLVRITRKRFDKGDK